MYVESALPVLKNYLRKLLPHHDRLTEDMVRYLLFLSLKETGLPMQHFYLEWPHSNIENAEVDLVVLDGNRRVVESVELKYFRRIPSRRNLPRTQKAGDMLNDVLRLHLMPLGTSAYLVLLTDNEMTSYFDSLRNGFRELFNLPKGSSFEITPGFVKSTSHTLQGRIKREWPHRVNAEMILSVGLPMEHALRVFQVATAG